MWQLPSLPTSFTFRNFSLSSSGRWRITFAGLLIFNKFNKKLKWRVKDNLCMDNHCTDIWEYTIIILCEFLVYPCNMQTLFVVKSSGSWIFDSQERKLKFKNSQLGTYFNKWIYITLLGENCRYVNIVLLHELFKLKSHISWHLSCLYLLFLCICTKDWLISSDIWITTLSVCLISDKCFWDAVDIET